MFTELLSRLTTPRFSEFPTSVVVHCRPRKIVTDSCSLTNRQELLEWWDQNRINQSQGLLVGCGGLGSNGAVILTQMGFGCLVFVEHDLVEDSNRNRQFFIDEDVGKPKAHRLIERVKPFATHDTLLIGHYMTFQQYVATEDVPKFDAIWCGVDNEPTMVDVARHGLATGTSVIFTNVSFDGEMCRTFIQRPGQACFACYKPESLTAKFRKQSCAPVPAIADLIHVAVGFGARAVVGEILGMPIGNWNCRDIGLAGIDSIRTIERKKGCELCG